jgi:hypothetical protein
MVDTKMQITLLITAKPASGYGRLSNLQQDFRIAWPESQNN